MCLPQLIDLKFRVEKCLYKVYVVLKKAWCFRIDDEARLLASNSNINFQEHLSQVKAMLAAATVLGS